MYAVVMFLKTVWDSHGVFYFRLRFLCLKQPIKKIRIQNSYVPLALRFSCQGSSRLREAKRAMGTRMGRNSKEIVGTQEQSSGNLRPRKKSRANEKIRTRLTFSSNHFSSFLYSTSCPIRTLATRQHEVNEIIFS